MPELSARFWAAIVQTTSPEKVSTQLENPFESRKFVAKSILRHKCRNRYQSQRASEEKLLPHPKTRLSGQVPLANARQFGNESVALESVQTLAEEEQKIRYSALSARKKQTCLPVISSMVQPYHGLFKKGTRGIAANLTQLDIQQERALRLSAEMDRLQIKLRK